MSSMIERFRSLPRAVQWAAMGGGVILAYFIVVEPTLDSMNLFSSRADAKEAMLASHAKSAETLRSAAETIEKGVRQYGRVDMPGDPEQRPLEFNRVVDEVLKKHGVLEQTSTSRVAPFGQGPLMGKFGQEFRIDRMLKDINFTAEAPVAAAVLADLERSPVVATVSRVQIRQAETRDRANPLVRVSLTVEAWLLVKKSTTTR
ncbi:MAG: hypothetical protein KF859_01545 [Phycisphaeraceae bacterium]|nr:hypothetical protein [Phycisphaeraceae bacterium]